jgi:hypothetical protein
MNPKDDPRQLALQRLAISRERMRAHLHEVSSPDRGEGEGRSHPVLDALMSIPGADIVVEAVRGWWSQHPLHLATLVAADATRTFVRPFARRNPFVLVAGAVAVGGLIFWLKPWRGFLRPALLAGLLPQLISRAVAHVPIESWISAVVTMATQQKKRAPAQEEAGAPAAASPQPAAPVAEPGAVDSAQAGPVPHGRNTAATPDPHPPNPGILH